MCTLKMYSIAIVVAGGGGRRAAGGARGPRACSNSAMEYIMRVYIIADKAGL